MDYYLPRFRKCYQVIATKEKSGIPNLSFPSEKNWSREKVEQDRQNLVSLLKIDTNEALRIVLHGHLRGVLTSEKRLLHHARLYLSEQRHLLKIVALLFTYRLNTPDYLPYEFQQLAETYSAEIMAEPELVSGIIDTILSNFKNPLFLEQDDDDDMASLFVSECLLFQIDLLNLLLVTVVTVLPSSSPMISRWADVIETTQYFTYPPSDILDRHSKLTDTIFALSTTITIAFFDFEQDFSVDGAAKLSYINNPTTLTKLHKTFSVLLTSKPSAAPAVFGWACVLNMIAIRLGINPDKAFDSFTHSVVPQSASFQKEPANALLTEVSQRIALAALNLQPFAILEKTQGLLPSNSLYVSIFKSYLKAGLPYVSLTDSLATCIRDILESFPALADDIFIDPFGDRLYTLAALRFPASIGPFVKLAQCLGDYAYDAISQLHTFMQPLPKEFTDYEFVENSPNTIRLTSNFPVFADATSSPIVIVSGTKGAIHTINQVRYVVWEYTYPGWGFLGTILENACRSARASTSAGLSYNDDVTEIIRLLTSTVASIPDPDKAKHLLTATAEGLADSDVVDVIFKICEDALASSNVNLAAVCIDFIAALSAILPDRVWSFLSGSSVLGKNGQRSDIANVLGATEIVSGKFNLTIAVLDLAEVLVDASVQTILTSRVSFKVRSEILYKLTCHAVVVFESFAYWVYVDQRQKLKIALQSVTMFGKVLRYLFDVDDNTSPAEKATAVLAAAAEYLVQQFLVPEKVVTRVLKPLIGTIETCASSVTSLNLDRPLEDQETIWVFAVLAFVSVLVQARSQLGMLPSQLEKNVFSLSPHLSVLYARYPFLRTAIIDVFGAIIKVAWPASEQPSLLAHLGEHAHMFISNLTGSLQNSLESEDTLIQIATCFSSIIESQQEGLSILLVTGRDTRKAAHIKQDVVSLLQVTENKVSDKGLPPNICLSFLRSIVSAYSNWKLGNLSSKPEFATSLISFIEDCYDLQIDDSVPSSRYIDYALQYSIAEQALLVFSVQMYKSPTSAGVQKFVKHLEKDSRLLNFSKKFLATTKPENLQSLVSNFDFRWSKLGGLRKFAKTRFRPLEYGVSYIYDIALLDSVLASQNAWVGFRKEVIAGNLELLWVDAQFKIIAAWSTFGTSLALYLSRTSNGTVPPLMAVLNKVSDMAVEKILGEEYSAPVLFSAVQHRVNLIFMVKYHAARCNILTKDYNSLQNLYNLLESSDYKLIEGIAHSGKVAEPSITYRQLLRTLSIMIDGFATASDNAYQVLQTVLGIFSTVIIDGMTAAAGAALNNPREGSDADIVIIISIFRKCLAVDGVSSMYDKIASLVQSSECIKSVMTLYSYSHALLNSSDDAVYGELALGYLLEALCIDGVANQLVSNGLFDLLMESPISRKIQQGGIKPTSSPKLYALWVKGILPLLLALLQKNGSGVVSGTAAVLDFFAEQTAFAIAAWRNPSEISVSVIAETTQLLLLAELIYKLAPEVAPVRPVLAAREELVGSIDYLLSHPRFLNTALVATSAEEQQLFLVEDTSDIPEGNKLLALVQSELKDLKALAQSRDTE